MINKNNSAKGFTLIELLVVIAIIGVLTTLITSNLTLAQARARDARRLADLDTIASGLEMYYSENSTYPGPGTTAGSFSFTSALIDASPGTNTYIKSPPVDPRNVAATYEYFYCTTTASPTVASPNRKFNLYAKLENGNAAEAYCKTGPSGSWSSATCDDTSLTVCRGSTGSTSANSTTIQGYTNYIKTEP
jgi:prepilin-type N-terminal cleavage/methylation domain-containing protein